MAKDSFKYKPSAAHLSADEVRRTFFQTSSSSDFRGEQQVAGCPAAGENFFEVLSAGQRSSKYLAYQIKRAPLQDRNACEYSREHTKYPLGDYVTACMLAKEYKGRGGIPGMGGGRNVKFSSSSHYTQAFSGFDPEETALAKRKSAKTRESLIAAEGESKETVSHAQESFCARPKMAWSTRDACKAPPDLLRRSEYRVPGKSQYQEMTASTANFGRQRCASAPHRKRPNNREVPSKERPCSAPDGQARKVSTRRVAAT
eukprot:TRINITY_DN97691_c0_g1_i1.p1 TRINITY_DN97691_c0_g1~~TRINITY_DN97691_c0_g1_i1.p1  ORF type:complete len:258 (+),score=47.15 TRINITY_DN97691_c0_g1_i1:60-833(+)